MAHPLNVQISFEPEYKDRDAKDYPPGTVFEDTALNRVMVTADLEGRHALVRVPNERTARNAGYTVQVPAWNHSKVVKFQDDIPDSSVLNLNTLAHNTVVQSDVGTLYLTVKGKLYDSDGGAVWAIGLSDHTALWCTPIMNGYVMTFDKEVTALARRDT